MKVPTPTEIADAQAIGSAVDAERILEVVVVSLKECWEPGKTIEMWPKMPEKGVSGVCRAVVDALGRAGWCAEFKKTEDQRDGVSWCLSIRALVRDRDDL